MGFLAGKRFLITGVLSNRWIAYGIARACHAQGAERRARRETRRKDHRPAHRAGPLERERVGQRRDVQSEQDQREIGKQQQGGAHGRTLSQLPALRAGRRRLAAARPGAAALAPAGAPCGTAFYAAAA